MEVLLTLTLLLQVFVEALGGTIDVMDSILDDSNGSIHGFVGPQSLVAVQQLVPLISRFLGVTSVSSCSVLDRLRLRQMCR